MTDEQKRIIRDIEEEMCADCDYHGEPNGCNREEGVCVAWDIAHKAADELERMIDVAEKSSVKAALFNEDLRLAVKMQKERDAAMELAERRLKRKNMYKKRSENDVKKVLGLRLELAKVKGERDAAINDLKDMVVAYDTPEVYNAIGRGICEWCGRLPDNSGYCDACTSLNSKFEWRGLRAENGGSNDGIQPTERQ